MLGKRLHPPVLLIRDSIAAGLKRYQTLWKKYFKSCKALNCSIPGDRAQHVLGIAEHLYVTYFIYSICCSSLWHKQLRLKWTIFIKIGRNFQEKSVDIKVILAGLSPQDTNKSKHRKKILKVNNNLKTLQRYIE